VIQSDVPETAKRLQWVGPFPMANLAKDAPRSHS
jgi:hypothetical protein